MSSEVTYIRQFVAYGADSAKGSERSSPSKSEVSLSTEERLLTEVQDGSKDALDQLFRRYALSVRSVAYRILRDKAEAEDLVQEIFLWIFRKAVLFDQTQGTARSWIFQVAYHRAFDRRRHLNARRFYATEELEEDCFAGTDSRWAPASSDRPVQTLLGKELVDRFDVLLSAEQKETIKLFFFEGYTLREIAQVTGRPLANVRTHYYRGLARLRAYLGPEKLRSK